jgi:WD40 repeat protein
MLFSKGNTMKKILAGLVLSFTLITTLASARVANEVLRMGAAGNIPGWGSINLANSSAVTGSLPNANGGTGGTSKSTGFDGLSPMTTSQDFIYGGASGTGTRLGVGSNGHALTVSGGVPAWAAQGGGGGSTFDANLIAGRVIPMYQYSAPTRTTKFTFTATINEIQYSPNGQYVAVCTQQSPYINIYKILGDHWTKLSNPATLPATCYGNTWSPDSRFLVVSHSSSPYFNIYERSGDTFTKLANPATLPSGVSTDVEFSQDGRFLSVASYASPYILNYEVVGSTFTKLSNPASLPVDQVSGVAWNRAGTILAVSVFSSPFLELYSVSGTTFTKISSPASLPSNVLSYGAQEMQFSPDGSLFCYTEGASSPFVHLYSVSGTTFTKLSNPATLPTGSAFACRFSSDGLYLAVGHNTSPRITVYSVSGTTFTKIADPASLPASDATGVQFSPDNKHLIVGEDAAGYNLFDYLTASAAPSVSGNSPLIKYNLEKP